VLGLWPISMLVNDVPKCRHGVSYHRCPFCPARLVRQTAVYFGGLRSKEILLTDGPHNRSKRRNEDVKKLIWLYARHKVVWGSGDIHPLILNVDTIWMSLVNFNINFKFSVQPHSSQPCQNFANEQYRKDRWTAIAQSV
jgi:hypothetical protein